MEPARLSPLNICKAAGGSIVKDEPEGNELLEERVETEGQGQIFLISDLKNEFQKGREQSVESKATKNSRMI